MSFLDKLKGFGKRNNDADLADEVSYVDAYSIADDSTEMRDTVQDIGLHTTHAVPDAAIISEASPSGGASRYLNTRMPAGDSPGHAPAPGGGVRLPLIGHLSSDQQQRLLGSVLAVGVLGLVLASVLAVRSAGGSAAQVGATGQALMQSQRLAKSVLQAMVGHPPAFPEVRNAADVLARNVRGLRDGGSVPGLEAAPLGAQPLLEPLLPLVDKAEKNAKIVLAQEQVLTQVGTALRAIGKQSTELLETAEAVAAFKVQQDALPTDISAAGQLVMLTQRIGKSASESLTVQGVSPEAVFLLGKDLNTFHDLTRGLLDGSPELRLTSSRDAPTRDRLQALLRAHEQLRTQAGVIVGNLQGLVSAREAQTAIIADSETLRAGLEEVQGALSAAGGMGWFNVLLIGASLLLGVIGGLGLLVVFTHDQRQRAMMADTQRHEAERQEREAKRVNDANQAAILRLMNELQSVAEGDLTQQATVTEDITGAIADSVNYTVEELRNLVSQVQGTAARVTDTTQQVEATSTELLAASDEQLREIRETGEAVLQMAGRIQRVSGQAQQSADVARESLMAATSGLTAVLDTITGMNTLRDQIQDTSKRIKRLGESSQEIGEITELISDITEQTNVLALNAAIQAASAGEAGRGFSVVAEEVQRLAERSGDATRAIAVLVKTIQTDTADAVAAMERSTQGVVEGAKLSDNAGTALAEIDRISRQLAELIEEIASQARREADGATVVAQNIQHIFAVTEQTGEGTRSTAQLVRQLSRIAEELRQSVARFKIS
ncbi:methyl-accepting chemotaxis sensory transducer [Leptothrix cholodnii SP-6]|uniref:Methyl-accepting chemotaxis sensory transducer n=1 Tax=Leptothrix cholodnii (strain ATCC 51168 / LMG 8142 / SP-6) TaxID=395495 RepID=B1Y8F6_LEPCP|nr:methyl-accepting chemotaxis protein [Leptothrix cholodnii]ACB36222.1 methyl-accepting chemotaxis sensory transducer [Leptothrix cholodnii SP-6]